MSPDTCNHKPRKWLMPYFVEMNQQLIRQASYLLDMGSPIRAYEPAYDSDYCDIREAIHEDRSRLYRANEERHYEDFQLANHLYKRGMKSLDLEQAGDLFFLRSLLIESLTRWHHDHILVPATFDYEGLLVGRDMGIIADFYQMLTGIQGIELKRPYNPFKRRAA